MRRDEDVAVVVGSTDKRARTCLKGTHTTRGRLVSYLVRKKESLSLTTINRLTELDDRWMRRR